MRALEKRLGQLENRAFPPVWLPWHQVIVDAGQAEEEAIAAYEAEHGPIGEDNLMILQVVEPQPCAR